jgi:serine-protein kinase ATM
MLLFHVARGKLSSPALSRYACFFLDGLIQSGIVAFADISDELDSMIASVDVNGPSTLSDSSVALWTTILGGYARHRPSNNLHVAEQAMSWLFSRWHAGAYTSANPFSAHG